ncbi:MAG: hypothetical protein E6J41_16255 [Chloroflexi bacterium]|nr:MAG: hypothetical protein E6J41_16255 [Chloroflexota bacterium]
MSKKRTADPPRPGQRPGQRPTPGRRPPVRRSGMPPWLLPLVMTVVALGVIFVAAFLYYRQTPTQSASSPTTAATGQTVDGVQCQTSEQVAYHIHAHLVIYASGQPQTVPYGIGIPNPQVDNSSGQPFVVGGSCFYWLHSHATDGVIHIESPDQRTYTLGTWFDIWGQPLSATQVGGDKGTVTAYVNGQRYTGDPRNIPLTAHAVIQLNVGQDVAPRPYTFASGL